MQHAVYQVQQQQYSSSFIFLFRFDLSLFFFSAPESERKPLSTLISQVFVYRFEPGSFLPPWSGCLWPSLKCGLLRGRRHLSLDIISSCFVFSSYSYEYLSFLHFIECVCRVCRIQYTMTYWYQVWHCIAAVLTAYLVRGNLLIAYLSVA